MGAAKGNLTKNGGIGGSVKNVLRKSNGANSQYFYQLEKCDIKTKGSVNII